MILRETNKNDTYHALILYRIIYIRVVDNISTCAFSGDVEGIDRLHNKEYFSSIEIVLSSVANIVKNKSKLDLLDW